MFKIKKMAFTVIELLIVVIILGVLTTVAIPQFIKGKQKVLNDQAKAMIITAYEATKMVFIEQNVNVNCASTSACIGVLGADIAASKFWQLSVSGTASSGAITASATNLLGDARVWTITNSNPTPHCTVSTPYCFGE